MLGKVFGVLCLISLITAILSGNVVSLGGAVLDGARSALDVSLSLCGMMCLWCGIMQVLEEAGVMRRLTRLLHRPLVFFFPDAARRGEGMEEICANFAANMLGIGNAATPMALRALEKMQSGNPDPETATGDMITLTVLNTCSVALLPSTILALRQQAGATRPFEVVVPIWICSFACAMLGLLITRLLRGREK